jgi:hypothetical protein
MSNRYRYGASLVAALFVGPRLALPLAWLGVRHTVAGVALILFVTTQLEAMPRFVRGSERFALYAGETRRLQAELDAHFGVALRSAPHSLEEGNRTIALVGVPVENPWHLRCQLGVFFGFPLERVGEVSFDLTDPATLDGLKSKGAGFVREQTACDEVWVWMPEGLVRGVSPLLAMRKNWRREGQLAERSFVQLLTLPALSAAP